MGRSETIAHLRDLARQALVMLDAGDIRAARTLVLAIDVRLSGSLGDGDREPEPHRSCGTREVR